MKAGNDIGPLLPRCVFSLEDIAAFKLDAITHRKEKKDYVAITLLLNKFSFEEMLGFYREKFPMNDKRLVLTQILDKEGLEMSFEPEMIIDFTPEKAFEKIEETVREYSEALVIKKALKEKNRWDSVSKLIKKRNEEIRKSKGESF